jgi:hypothetical protein
MKQENLDMLSKVFNAVWIDIVSMSGNFPQKKNETVYYSTIKKKNNHTHSITLFVFPGLCFFLHTQNCDFKEQTFKKKKKKKKKKPLLICT